MDCKVFVYRYPPSLNLVKDPSKVSGALMGNLLPLSSSAFLSCGNAVARTLANPAMASSSFTDAGGFFHGIGQGRLLGVLGSEEGSESSGSPVAVLGPLGGTLPPPSPPVRNVSWVSSMASRSRPVSFRKVFAGSASK